MTGTSGHPTSTCPQGPTAWPEEEQTGGSSSRYTFGVGLFSCGAPSMSGSMLKKKATHISDYFCIMLGITGRVSLLLQNFGFLSK